MLTDVRTSRNFVVNSLITRETAPFLKGNMYSFEITILIFMSVYGYSLHIVKHLTDFRKA
jgi:hypothetical protein